MFVDTFTWGKKGDSPVVRTRLQTFAKRLRGLQPQAVHDFGAMLADVSDTSIAKLMTRLTF